MFDKRRDALVADARELVGKFTISDEGGSVLVEAENKISTARVNDVITVSPTVSVAGGEPVMLGPTLKVHVPEHEKQPHAVFEDIEFDDALIAKMMANIAANGMTFADLGG